MKNIIVVVVVFKLVAIPVLGLVDGLKPCAILAEYGGGRGLDVGQDGEQQQT
jgi:hypothetical protein